MNSDAISTKLPKITALLSMTTALLFMVTSCSSGTLPASDPSSSSSSTTMASNAKPGDVINGLPTKTQLVNNGKGEYIQTTISDDDPAMKYNAAIVSPETSQFYSPEEIADAQKFIMKFIAEESIDSQINDNSSDAKNIDAWWAKNKDKIDPAWQTSMLQDLKGNDLSKALVFRTNFRTSDAAHAYGLTYGTNKTRVLSRQLTSTKIQGETLQGTPDLRFTVTGSFTMSAMVDDKVVKEDTKAEFNFTLRKNPSSEYKWMISGYKNTFNVIPAK